MKPFSDAKTVIDLYNESVKDNSLTQEHWNDILSICDDSLSDYLTKIKGQEATLTGYNTSLQGNITGFRKVYKAIGEYNKLSGSNSEKQKEYCEAISLTNSKLGSYLTNLNGSKAGMLGYASSLVGATLKTVALQVATTALNAAITMGASLIVTGIITAISNWIRQDEILAEKAETAKQKIDELNNNYKEHSQLVSDSAKRYAELAQGVDQLSGKNLSLNDDDYKEFLDLSNQLAEAFPTLSRHYDENGNAILQLSGNVDTIVGSLNNLIEAERALKNQEIADELPTVYKNANNKSDDYKKQIDELKEQRKTLIDSLGDVQSDDFSKNFIDGLEKSMISVEGENLETLSKMKDDYLKILKDANIDYEELTPDYENKDGVDVPVRFNIKINSSEEDIEKAKKTIKANVENLASEYEGDISELNDKIQSVQDKNKANWSSLTGSIAAWLNTEDSYKIMSDDMQSTIQNIVNSLDWGELDFSSWEDAKQYIQDNILSLFQTSDGKDVLKNIEVMFGIQTQFNDGEITVNEYQEKLKTFLDEISTLDPDTQKAIKLIFGISTDEDGTTTSSVDTMVNNVKSKLKDEFDDKVGELSLDDLQVASKLEIPEGTLLSWDELKQKIEETKNAASEETPISTPTFSATVSSLKDLKDQLSDLDTIMASFISGDDIDVSSFDNIINKFTELKEAGKDIQMSSVEDAINQIGNSSSIEEAQSSLDSLCQQYINASGILDNLTESNAGFVQSQLEQIGVSNAAEIVQEQLNATLAAQSVGLNDTTLAINSETGELDANSQTLINNIQALVDNENASLNTKEAVYELTVQEQIFNNQGLDLSGKIKALKDLATAYGVTMDAANGLSQAEQLKTGNWSSDREAAYMKSRGFTEQQIVAHFSDKIQSQIEAKFKGLDGSYSGKATPKYGGGSSTKKAYEDAAKDAKKSADKAKDDAEKAAEEARQKAEAELDAYLKYQEAMLDANEITVSQYADAVSDRLTEMFENGEISASKFYSGVETMCKKQLDIYDKVKDAVVRRYDKEIDKIQETMDAIDEQNEALNKQKDIMDKQLQYVKAMEEVEIDKLTREKEAYEKENEAYEKQKDTMDKAVSYATTLIDKKIEKINDESDALDKLSEKYNQQQTDYQNMLSGIDKVYDDRIDELNKQSDAIQDQIDKIQDENSELDLQYRKEQALYALSKAQNQRTKKLYVKGRGIIYTQDDEAIRDAKKDLKDIETEEVVSKLNKEKEAIADQIEEVQKWKDKWSEISNAYQEKINNELLVNHFGTDYVNKILSGNISDYNDFKNAYLNIQTKIDDMSEQKKALEEELDAWNQKKDAWSKVTDAAQNEENKQAAIQQWGKDYAKIILDARQSDLQNFETNYLFINDRINDNQGAIDSLDELIAIHEQKKQSYEDLTTAIENEELKRELNRELSRTWEQDTLNASELDWDAWKDRYLGIQDQINDNEDLKTSYKEKKDELETWRDKWSDSTTTIQNAIDDQYAAQILGQNWESTIFTDREKNLKTFTNAYVSLYQKQADAAINAANAEVTAAKNARAEIASSSTSVDNGSSTSSSSYSTGGGGGSSTPKPKERSDKYWTFQYFGGGYSSEAEAKKHMGDYAGANGTTKYGSQYFVVKWLQGCETSAIAANYVNVLRSTAKKNKYNYVKRFHSGLELGRISKTNGEDFNTVQRVGTQGLKSDEVPIIAQAGEAVVTEKQIENLAEAIDYIPVYQEILDKISEVANAGKMDEVAKMIPKAKYDTPKPKEVTQNNQTINVTQDINVNCPNVTNTTGAEYLVKALRKASADVLVYNK